MGTVGSISYATSRGIGHLCHDFHTHGIVDDVCVVRHPGVPTNEHWYPNAPSVDLRAMDRNVLRKYCDGHSTMLFFETPFDWEMIPYCRAKGIKTAIITMYECTPERIDQIHVPDYWLCPSLLDLKYFADLEKFPIANYAAHPFLTADGKYHNQCTFTPLPVEYPWKLRTRAERFVHRGGYLGVRGREGTENLIEAMQYVKSPISLLIQVQENVSEEAQRRMAADKRIEYVAGGVRYEELYATGDVAIGAQKWNGCSLPLQEQRASGMLVMNTDRYPMNTWLPRMLTAYQIDPPVNPLIPVDHYIKGRIAGRFMEFDEAIVTPVAIAAKIDEVYGTDISEYSQSAVKWAADNSWEVLGPKFKELLQGDS